MPIQNRNAYSGMCTHSQPRTTIAKLNTTAYPLNKALNPNRYPPCLPLYSRPNPILNQTPLAKILTFPEIVSYVFPIASPTSTLQKHPNPTYQNQSLTKPRANPQNRLQNLQST